MVQPRFAGRRRFSAQALPRVQSDVMVITPGREKRGLIFEALRQLKAVYIAIESQGAIQIRNFQVDVADRDGGVDQKEYQPYSVGFLNRLSNAVRASWGERGEGADAWEPC